MPREFVLRLEENSIRLTPDGEIAIIDAIKALSESDNPEEIWQKLQHENPEIVTNCKRFRFSDSKSVLVADSLGWDRIEPLLFDYILDQNLLR
jgi:hypothetical protein